MTRADGAYTTKDMAFATVLIMHGHNPIMERVAEGQVVWVIPAEEWDESIETLEHDYKSGACLVDPRRFMRESRDVRQRMYQFLGIGDKPRGTPVRRKS